MAREEKTLINKTTGTKVMGPRQFDRPDDDHIITAIEEANPDTAWVPFAKGGKRNPRKGESLVRDQIAKPLPYVEGETVYFDGWKITGTYIPPTAEEIAQKRLDRLTGRVDSVDTLLAEAVGILFALCFAQQNEIRVLQGDPPIPTTVAGAEAFLNGVDALPRLSDEKLKAFLLNALDQIEP